MAASVVDLFREASSLDEGDRAALAGLLLESLEQAPDPAADAAWAKEIERRAHQLDAGEIETIPWEDVKARLSATVHDARKR